MIRAALALGLLGACAGAAVFSHWAYHHGAPFLATAVAVSVMVNLQTVRDLIRHGRGAA